jgi:hypothetical protein
MDIPLLCLIEQVRHVISCDLPASATPENAAARTPLADVDPLDRNRGVGVLRESDADIANVRFALNALPVIGLCLLPELATVAYEVLSPTLGAHALCHTFIVVCRQVELD